MKKLYLFAYIFFALNLHAQNNDSLEAFGKAYFEHYQKKDYDWIRNCHDTYLKLAKKHINKNRKRPLKDQNTTWQHDDFKRSAESNSLKNEYGIKGLLGRSEYVRTEIYHYTEKHSLFRKQHKMGIKIFSRPKNHNGSYYLDPGCWIRSPKGPWSFHAYKMGVHYNHNTRITEPWITFLNYRGSYSNPNYDRLDEIRATEEVIYPSEIAEKIMANIEAENKARQEEYERVYNNSLAEYKAKIKRGEKAEMPKLRATERIFVSVLQQATFPGGEERMFEYIKEHLEYPNLSKRKQKEGMVYLTFMVEPDGSIGNTTIVKSLGPAYDENAIKVLKKMPKWRLARFNGYSIRSEYMISIPFESQ